MGATKKTICLAQISKWSSLLREILFPARIAFEKQSEIFRKFPPAGSPLKIYFPSGGWPNPHPADP